MFAFLLPFFGLAMLTLLAVVLTAAAAITSAQASAALMRTTSDARRLTVVLSTCFFWNLSRRIYRIYHDSAVENSTETALNLASNIDMYAIDFGTSNTVITRWNTATQEAETISLPGLSVAVGKDSPPLVPSLLYIEKAAAAAVKTQAVSGQAVRDRGLDLTHDPRFFSQL